MSPLTPKQQKALLEILTDAVEDKNLECVKKCLGKGADLNGFISSSYCYHVPNACDDAPRQGNISGPIFHYVCRNYFEENIAEVFLQNGVDVDVRDSKGNTALLWAARTGNHKVIKYLLSKGADPLAQNKAGESALDAASASDHEWNPAKKLILQDLLEAMPNVPANDFNHAALTRDTPVSKPLDFKNISKKPAP